MADGSRRQLTAAFLRDLQALWERDGAQILREAAERSPQTIVQVQAELQSRALTDDELAAAIVRGIAARRRIQ